MDRGGGGGLDSRDVTVASLQMTSFNLIRTMTPHTLDPPRQSQSHNASPTGAIVRRRHAAKGDNEHATQDRRHHLPPSTPPRRLPSLAPAAPAAVSTTLIQLCRGAHLQPLPPPVHGPPVVLTLSGSVPAAVPHCPATRLCRQAYLLPQPSFLRLAAIRVPLVAPNPKPEALTSPAEAAA